MKNFLDFFKKKNIIPEDIVINVDNFNTWFNDLNNGAIYAHPGIFLRIDKLSESQVLDYIKKSYNKDTYEFYKDKYYLTQSLYTRIIYDWKHKLKND